MPEVWVNDGQAVVTSGGTGAPSAGTVETWTLTASTLPVLSSSGWFYAADDNAAGEPEKFLFTANNGTTATVTRGADGTTPVAHAAGFSVSQVIARATLERLQGGGTRPEWYGTIGSGSDDVAINAAISAVSAGTAYGPVVLSQPYTISSTITLLPGVNLAGSGQGNRQVGPPDTFAGAYIQPSSSFPASTPLITIGTAGDPATNPNGCQLDGVCLSGYSGTAYVTGCQGVLITDTTDVHMTDCFLGNFDRAGATGTCVYLSSATAGNCYGFSAQNCVFSASWQGVYMTGAGVTDMRFANNLFHSNTKSLTIGGSNLGGGGGQLVNNHFTYSGMPSTGWHLSMGSQAGDFMVTNNYFDNGGSAEVVQLATAKGVFCGNHFLATSTSTAAALVKVSTSGSQELTFCNNDCNGNGSSITALLQTSAHSGAPTGGIYTGNAVYGTAASLIAVLIDSANTAIAAANTSSLYVAGNCSFT